MRLQASLLIALGMIGGCERTPPASQPAIPASAPAQPMQATVPTAPPPAAQHTEPQLPALYSGVIPCADCEGIRHELDLRANNVFFLRMIYLGKPHRQCLRLVGHWSMGDDRAWRCSAATSTGAWSMEDVGTLRKLDMHGNPIDSRLNFSLSSPPSLHAAGAEGHDAWRVSVHGRLSAVRGMPHRTEDAGRKRRVTTPPSKGLSEGAQGARATVLTTSKDGLASSGDGRRPGRRHADRGQTRIRSGRTKLWRTRRNARTGGHPLGAGPASAKK